MKLKRQGTVSGSSRSQYSRETMLGVGTSTSMKTGSSVKIMFVYKVKCLVTAIEITRKYIIVATLKEKSRLQDWSNHIILYCDCLNNSNMSILESFL